MWSRWPVRTVTIVVDVAIAAQRGGLWAADVESDRWEKPPSNLRDRDLTVRRAAANSLVDLAVESALEQRPPARAEAFKRHLKAIAEIVRDKREDPGVRALLVRAVGIGKFGPLARETVPALIGVLIDEMDHEEVRSWCAMVLPEIGPPEQVGPAILAASQSGALNVKVNA